MRKKQAAGLHRIVDYPCRAEMHFAWFRIRGRKKAQCLSIVHFGLCGSLLWVPSDLRLCFDPRSLNTDQIRGPLTL
jgi:hypothetical protein